MAKYNMDTMQKLASERGGECLSKKYVNMTAKLMWKCKEGHIWETTPSNIKHAKSWCPICAKEVIRNSKIKYSIDTLKSYASSKDGVCLSEKYMGYHQNHVWQCQYGHIWEAAPANILRNISWCPICGQKRVAKKLRKYTIEDVKKLALKNNGECLSEEFISINHKLEWKCDKEHVWFTSFYSIQKKKTWCPYCVGKHKTIKDMQKLAEARGGQCLSGKYINNETKLKWQCKHGHIWEAKYGKIQQGQWCPHCFYKTEQKFREVLEKIFNIQFPQKYPKWLVNDNGNRLQLDGYNEKLGIAFEYQGIQHFKVKDIWGGEKALIKTQKHDQIKKELCKRHNIILLCPTYELDLSDFEEFVKEHLDL